MEQWEVGEVMEQQQALQVNKKQKNESLLRTNRLQPCIESSDPSINNFDQLTIDNNQFISTFELISHQNCQITVVNNHVLVFEPFLN